MDLKRYGLKTGQHIPGQVVHRYFTDFAEHFGLDKFFRPRTKVTSAVLQDDGTWLLEYTHLSGQFQSEKISCSRLVIATGLTSEASMPTLSGSSDFEGSLFHAKDLHKRVWELKNSQEVVVIGGNKSAWDVCYSVAMGGARAHMVMRPSGGGPSWVWRPFYLFRSKFTLARLSSTRLFSWFDPAPFGTTFISARRFLQETTIGRWLTWGFWTLLDSFLVRATGYDDPRLRMLRPWTSTFWMGNSLSVHNYDTDWFELVRKGRIIVHHAEVTSLDKTAVHLSDGNDLQADALVCCTGWKCVPPIKFEPEGISEEMGLPRRMKTNHQNHDAGSMHVSRTRDQPVGNDMSSCSRGDWNIRSWIHGQITARCTLLGSLPRRTLPTSDETGKWSSPETHAGTDQPLSIDFRETPYQLYRFLVPTSPRFLALRNVAFVGMHRSVHAVVVAQAQALWISAFFQNRIPFFLLDPETARYEALWHAEYGRLRRPRESGGSGASFPDLVFDSIPYTDLLLEDLGLKTLRKRGLWANITEPHLPADYKGLLEEWRKVHGA